MDLFFGDSKKSQLSLVIVIVLVIVAVGLIVYFSSSANMNGPEKLDTSSVDNFVQNCFSTAVNNGFLLSMKQGGNIFQAQGGYAYDFSASNFDLKYSSNIIPYFIRGFDESSFYGYNDYDMLGNFALKPTGNILFGFPFSCETYGYARSSTGNYYYPAFNSISKTSGQGVIFDSQNCIKSSLYLSPVPAQYIFPSNFKQNVEKNLEKYVSSNFMTCINKFDSFKNQYNIFYSKENISIKFTNNSLIANLDFPITIKKYSNSAKGSLQNFSYKVTGLRINPMLKFVNSVLLKISSNASFDPNNVQYDGFKVLSVKNVDGKGDILIKVVDSKTFVAGNPLEFWFAEKVRPPLIHYFPSQIAILGPNGLINQTKNTNVAFKYYYEYMKCCCPIRSQPSSECSTLINQNLCSDQVYGTCSTVLENYFNNTLTKENGFSFFNATDLNGYPVTIATNFSSMSDYTGFFNSNNGILTFKINASNGFANSERIFKILLQ